MPGLLHSINFWIASSRVWAIVPGLREWVVVTLVVVMLYGRTRLLRARRPWAVFGRDARSRHHRSSPHTWARWVGQRWIKLVVGCVGVAVVAWLATSLHVVRAVTHR